MSLKGRRRCRSLPPDILSNLPDNIIDVILICLPSKEAVRTSILSKKWRYHWRRLTELTIDQSHWSTEEDLLYPTFKFSKLVYQLLTLHEGPITKFTIDITRLRSCPEIDFFIYLLSMNGIQHLVLHLPWKEGEEYKLSSLFTCLQLRHLALENCFIHPPSNFQGFDRLITLELCNVTISSELLGSLISHCSLLENLALVLSEVPVSNMIEINASKLKSFDFSGCISYISLTNVPLLTKVSLDLCEGSSMEAHNFHFVKFFESCFALEHLLFQFCFDEIDIAKPDEAPTRLPFDHNRVKRFCLPGIILELTYETLCCFCLLRSFPYLEYLEIEVCNDGDGYGYGDVELFKLERFADVTFNHLREVKLGEFWGDAHELEFLKLLLAKSPVLVTVTIDSYLLPKRRSKILAEVSNFWHVSPTVEVICRDLQRRSSIFEDETNRWKRMLLYY
ncbi:F-box/FBD/LRR-repeat protein At1g13570-like [Solanum pennellii]|uniref:F-box/FBD/LRR-repeat protein At1g13570-like n=1 Tax=Solanum pennellii TaxID=28526 RepID=A0ABM1FIQ0_SOLPN|nr:F-box/FBD/LRR-repeat protein At1g13570-like [Solanum pennellii]